jgi:hypothetical protein
MRVNQYEYAEAKRKLKETYKQYKNQYKGLGYAMLTDKFKKIIKQYKIENNLKL